MLAVFRLRKWNWFRLVLWWWLGNLCNCYWWWWGSNEIGDGKIGGWWFWLWIIGGSGDFFLKMKGCFVLVLLCIPCCNCNKNMHVSICLSWYVVLRKWYFFILFLFYLLLISNLPPFYKLLNSHYITSFYTTGWIWFGIS